MSVPTAPPVLPTTTAISANLGEGEVRQDQVPAGLSQGSLGTGEPPKDSSTSRLKLVLKRENTSQEVRSADSRVSRAGRVIKPPIAYTPAPTAAAAKRKPATRKKDTNIVCVRCQRGNSPNTNVIVFCDGCNATWHQKCHDPPIDDEVVKVMEAEWHCHKCKPVPRRSDSTKKSTKVQKPSRKIHPRLQQGPRLDVGGNQFTADERRAYLSCLSHAALVELLVNVSTQNPTVPMFPANMRDLPASEFPALPTTLTNSSATTNVPISPSISTNSKKRARAESPAFLEETFGADDSAKPSKRARTTSAPTKPEKQNTNQRKQRIRTTSAPTKPSAPQPSSKRKSYTISHTSSATSHRQASIDESASNAPALSAETTSTTTSQTRVRPPLQLYQSYRDSSPDDSEPETEDDDVEEIEDHRLYPRAGNGFSPSSDPADLNILQEDSGSQTFSHGLHGPAKRARAMQAPARVWSQRLRK
ncbi:uncharacterized protein N7459_004977 [Penicillium hispanicum]|uniref:uncharacterized protein n=1 Tax=Penicillium hispanicum TaxID=1080232 RepID=UPI00253F88E6|nr:uncharacterized protein N7459_004977 [Penicillium hispanicum]KAJ5585177.1 hypothetical protein N7459_004977 [Penicillium hispanicum]